jgi:hypothetical protein
VSTSKEAASPTPTPPQKSSDHVAFVQRLGDGSWGEATNPLRATHELLTDAGGVMLFRAEIDANLVGFKGADRRARRGVTLCTGSHAMNMTLEAFGMRRRFGTHKVDAAELASPSQKKRAAASAQVDDGKPAPLDGFDRWTWTTKKKSSTGQEYKVYFAPDGSKLYSMKQVRAAFAKA